MTISRILKAVSLGESQTNYVLSQAFSPEDPTHFRANVLVGKVAVSAAVTMGLMESAGYGIWAATKTAAITDSTDTTVSAIDTETGACTAAGSGLAAGDYVVINAATTMPTGLTLNQLYVVDRVSGNDFYLKNPGAAPYDIIIPEDDGTGTITVTKCRLFSIKFLAEVAGDQAHLPLPSAVKVVATTGASDSLQVLDVIA